MQLAVRYKKDGKNYTIYDVLYKRGYPFFLVYMNGQWILKSGKHFVPINKGSELNV